ncbi:hypothetical protein HPP92_005714 [Vanilla planifolia]|uniref:Uncharacterized protein n=1 Tax=Vanilla planifolia TaxID=51239 RepID=A0A835RLX8_VANPL|nr:hypothetical protein HPP92_005714 [Vanilla planifolia]
MAASMALMPLHLFRLLETSSKESTAGENVQAIFNKEAIKMKLEENLDHFGWIGNNLGRRSVLKSRDDDPLAAIQGSAPEAALDDKSEKVDGTELRSVEKDGPIWKLMQAVK